MYLIFFVTYCLVILFLFAYLAKDATYFGRGFIKDNFGQISHKTDQEKMLDQSKDFGYMFWPSKIHSSTGRGQLREIWVFFANLTALLMKRRDEFVNIFLSLLCNFFSSILLFFLLSRLFSTQAAFFGAFLYSTSLWPYQVAYFFGHIHLSQLFFICSLILIDLASSYSILTSIPIIFFAGFFAVICFSSSSASRKYPPIIIFFFLFKFKETIVFDFSLTNIYIYISSLLVLWSLYFYNKIFFKKILIYKISKYVKNEKKEFYLLKSLKYIKFFFIIIFPIGLLFIFLTKNYFFYHSFFFILGFSFGAFIILWPNFFYNLSRYIIFLDIGNWANHFKSYPRNFFGKKITESNNFISPRIWYINFFTRFCPIVFFLYILSILFLIFYKNIDVNQKIFFILFSLIPIFIIELTKAMRVGKSYLPIYFGFIFLITAASNYILIINPDFFRLMIFIIIINTIHKFYFFFSDILPCRLGPSYLGKFLIKNKIRTFGTYNNPYNHSVLGPLLEKFPGKFKVFFFESISKCKNINFFLIPPRSSKSVNMETEIDAIKNGDFNNDKTLEKLIKKGNFNQKIIAKFKSMGCSKFYVAESEVTGYREFCLKEINDEDRNLGFFYIVKLN